jgi:hypothetical protein
MPDPNNPNLPQQGPVIAPNVPPGNVNPGAINVPAQGMGGPMAPTGVIPYTPAYPGHSPGEPPTPQSLQSAMSYIAQNANASHVLSPSALSNIKKAVNPQSDQSLGAAINHVAAHPLAKMTLPTTTMSAIQRAAGKMTPPTTLGDPQAQGAAPAPMVPNAIQALNGGAGPRMVVPPSGPANPPGGPQMPPQQMGAGSAPTGAPALPNPNPAAMAALQRMFASQQQPQRPTQ